MQAHPTQTRQLREGVESASSLLRICSRGVRSRLHGCLLAHFLRQRVQGVLIRRGRRGAVVNSTRRQRSNGLLFKQVAALEEDVVVRPLPLTPVAHGTAMAQCQQPELAILIFS